jgi:hypothetical protein
MVESLYARFKATSMSALEVTIVIPWMYQKQLIAILASAIKVGSLIQSQIQRLIPILASRFGLIQTLQVWQNIFQRLLNLISHVALPLCLAISRRA